MKTKTIKNKQAISLIVLIITIIVMIVLAGAIILSLNNSGIIGKANQAVRDTDEATVKEIVQIAWAEAYADGVRKVEKVGDKLGFQGRVEEALTKNQVDMSYYGMIVTTSGVEVVRGWIQHGTTVKKGDVVLKVGETVNYDETNGGSITVPNDVTWVVAGAKDGALLIASRANVVDEFSLTGKDGWANSTKYLDKECEVYGGGKNAVKARSITIEDINNLTEYDPQKHMYQKGTISEYGNVVTYTHTGGKINYNSKNKSGTTTLKITLTYYDNGEWKTLTDGESSTPIKCNSYIYDPVGINQYSYANGSYGVATDSKANHALFKNLSANGYFLAGQMIFTFSGKVYYGIPCMGSNPRGIRGVTINENHLFETEEGESILTHGIRAVVELSPETKLSGSGTTSWDIE